MLKRICSILYIIICLIAIAMLSMIGVTANYIDTDYKIIKGNPLVVSTSLPVTAEYKGQPLLDSALINNIGEKFNVNLKLFGIFPVAKTNVEVVDETYCAVLGTPFGVKIYTDGVLIIDIKEVQTERGSVSPARLAGLKIGDSIISINGEKVTSNEDVAGIIENSNGEKLDVLIKRQDKIQNIILQPEYSVEAGCYKAGIWVRDSSAGIGMLTFYSPATDVICGLGHGVCDEDTGKIFEFSEGELVSATVISSKKGVSGSPGELKGKFTLEKVGDLLKNCNIGVYGNCKCNIDLKNLTKIALKQEIYEGAATIITTVDGAEPKEYACTVKLKVSNYESETRNFIIKITDEALIDRTGGIIQGMSGSPIMQNGKLIGAVTHVLVDDPTTGYGIFAENMLDEAEKINVETVKIAS